MCRRSSWRRLVRQGVFCFQQRKSLFTVKKLLYFHTTILFEQDKTAGSRVALCVFILGRFVKEKQVLPLGGEGF